MAVKTPKETMKILKLQNEEIRKHLENRDEVLYLYNIGLISKLNIIQIGPPGTAKTLGINMKIKFIDVQDFFLQYTSFTTEEELIGPLDIGELKNGKRVPKFAKYLPGSPFGNHDEIGRADAIKNSTNSLIHEGYYKVDGETKVRNRLIDIASSNTELLDVKDQALNDRFQIKIYVGDISDEKILANIFTQQFRKKNMVIDPALILSMEDIMEARKHLEDNYESFWTPEMIAFGVKIFLQINQELGIRISPRTGVFGSLAVATNAMLNGRDKIIEEDFEILQYIYLSELKDHSRVRKLIMSHTNKQVEFINCVLDEATNTFSEWQDATGAGQAIDHRKVADKLKKFLAVLKNSKVEGRNQKIAKDAITAIEKYYEPLLLIVNRLKQGVE